LSGFTQKELDAIAWKLNTRPRKSLGFQCPAQLFTPDGFDFKQHHAAPLHLGLETAQKSAAPPAIRAAAE